MGELDDWVAHVATELGLGDDLPIDVLLDVARDVAHGVLRPAAPATTYLIGLAVARGGEPAAIARRVSELASQWHASDRTP